MKRHLALAWILAGSVLALIPITVFLNASASNSKSRPAEIGLARLSDRATVHAAGRGAPRINLADGHEVLTAYDGDPEARRLLQQNLAQPLAIASSDFDEDGVPDLVTGYAAPNGGILTLHRGNVDSIYPNTLEAQQRRAAGNFTNAPFLSPALAVEIPRPSDFIGCGDFDADGHRDIVTAARGSRALYFFLGDGQGNLSAARQTDLAGSVTSLITGEVNRADGLADIVVGVSVGDRPKVLVFEAPDGALTAQPEVFPLRGEAGALALGQFDDDFPMDLAVATGRELMIVSGRAQRSSLTETKRTRAPKASIDRRSFDLAIRSLAVGDFTGHHKDDLSVLFDNGSVHLLSRSVAVSRAKTRKSSLLRGWQDEALPGSWPQARLLTSAHVASTPMDNVVVIDSQAHRLELVAKKTGMQASGQSSVVGESLNVDSEPVAALPMRLNGDALSDLVILRKGNIAPSVVSTLALMTFTVTNTADGGPGSLAQAITDANVNPGADLINFNIGAGGSQTIIPVFRLPAITDPVTIDGTTQPGFAGNPIIELDGSLSDAGALSLAGGSTTIRGLVINRFAGDAVFVQTAGGNIIERNFIGTVIAGNAAAPNGGNGVEITDSINNLVGGTAAAASNVISGNTGIGVTATDSTATTLVQGNLIGTDLTGTIALGNVSGVDLSAGITNTIGGTSAGARNIISGNVGPGVVIQANTQGTLVQGNFIGTDITGAAALGNGGSGVVITIGSDNNSIGGTPGGAGNRIALNGLNGILNQSGSGNAFLSNSIFSNGSGPGLGIELGDDAVTPNDGCDGDPGPNGLQNFPVVTSASSDGSNTAIAGSLNSTGLSSFRIEFFSNPTCDDSGFGQGQTFLGAANVTTASDCGATFSVVFPVGVAAGQVITATATDPDNSTSEFSQCVSVVAVPVSDLQITKSDSPDPVVTGSNITYTMVVTNNGPDTDAGATFTDVVPVGTTFVSLSSPGSCTTPTVGGTGTVSCSFGIASSSSATITLVVKVTAAADSTISNTAMISGSSSDPVPGNNSATASTAVVAAGPLSDLQITKSDSPDPVITGSNITYTMVVTNNGPDTDAGATFTDLVPVGTTFVSLSSAGSCSSPPVGGAGTVSCSFGIAPGSSTTITLVVKVTAPAGSTITNTAMINGTSSDPVPGNNSATASTVVGAGPVSDLQITKSDSPDPVVTGSNITYTMVVTNNGPDTDAGATFTDVVPAGTTFVSLSGPGSCTTPPVGGTGTVSCSFVIAPGSSTTITLVVKVTAAPGSTITNTAMISGASSDPVPGNNSATAVTASCTFTCPPDLVATTPNILSCGTSVTYSPSAAGACGTVNCVPPSGSRFAVGVTFVTCSAPGASTSCFFSVTVVDNIPPSVFCPASISTPTTPGQASAVVNYPAANVTDNCTASVECSPSSGTRFPVGTTVVTCTATDSSENSTSCSFSVVVVDTEAPVITCPASFNVVPPSGQTSAVVNYPAPTISDNLPGVTVVCAPPSGSSFPAGTTTVNCAATDTANNRSICSFIVGVGGPQGKVTIPENKTAVEFSTVGPTRRPRPKNSPCSFFTVENVGFAPLVLTFDSLKRTGSDVTNGRISDPNDTNAVAEIAPTKFFILSLVNSDQSLTQLNIGAMLTLQPGQAQPLCLKFAALIPGLAGKTTGLAASDVLPNILTSTIIFRQNAGANIEIPILARVSTALVLVNLSNPRALPEVLFTRSGNDITVSYAVFDSNLDVTRAKYELLDASGQVVAGPFEIDLGGPLRSLNLVVGQSFSVEQRFTGANDNPQITGVRLTVFDGETSTAGSSSASAPAIVAPRIQLLKQARGVTLYPPALKLNPSLP